MSTVWLRIQSGHTHQGTRHQNAWGFIQSTRRPSCRVASAEGTLTHFCDGWCRLLSKKTYLPAASLCSLGFLIVSGWVPGISIPKERSGRSHVLRLTWTQRLQSNVSPVTYELKQSQAQPIQGKQINCISRREMTISWSSVWDQK